MTCRIWTATQNIDSRDIKAYTDLGDDKKFGGTGGNADLPNPLAVKYNTADGTVELPANTQAVEFKIKVTEIIGARHGFYPGRSRSWQQLCS